MWQDSTQQVLSQSISFFMNQINSPTFLFLLIGIIIIILRSVFLQPHIPSTIHV